MNQMHDSDHGSSKYLSPLHGPQSAWTRDYDVPGRMWELEKFWLAGVTVALYDALRHVKAYPEFDPPTWILDATLKIVEERLRAGFETKKKLGQKNDERKIYRSEITSYYRWREVEKWRSADRGVEEACTLASAALAKTDYKGGAETMRKDYQKVSRDLQDPARAYRYYSAMPETREITGTALKPPG
jgi:hypothetical protein